MNKNKIITLAFCLAGCCFVAGVLNHIINTGEGILSSSLLAAGCFCMAFAFHKNK